MIDPYKILGVDKGASQDDIKKAYKKLAKTYHPDRNPDNKEAEVKFKEINEAYQLIGSPEARKKYDQGGIDEEFFRSHQPRGGFDFSFDDIDTDFFENIFGFGGQFGFDNIFGQGGRGPGAGGGFQSQGRTSLKGQDQVFQMNIPFTEAIAGSTREVTFPTGKRFQVKIPAGIKEGQKLRFKGQGAPGIQGGPPGDLYIEVHITDDERFIRRGNDVEVVTDIPLDVAVLGGEVTVIAPTKKVSVKVPKNSSSGTKLRLRGLGVGGKGDLLVNLKIKLPSHPDSNLEDAIRQWKEQ